MYLLVFGIIYIMNFKKRLVNVLQKSKAKQVVREGM